MHRRQFLLGSVVLTATLAGCSGGESTDADDESGDGDGRYGDSGGDDSGPDWSVTGELRNSENFEAVELGGLPNNDNTLTLGGELRYTGEGSVVVSDVFYNFYDADGRGLVSVNLGLGSERTVATGDTVAFEHTTDDLGKTEAGTVGSFEAIVGSRPA